MLAWALLHYRGDMFKICRSSSGRWVLFSVSGRIDGEAVSELKSLLGRESAGSKLLLDLEEVRIVDAEAVEFFARCEDAGSGFGNALRMSRSGSRATGVRASPGHRRWRDYFSATAEASALLGSTLT